MRFFTVLFLFVAAAALSAQAYFAWLTYKNPAPAGRQQVLGWDRQSVCRSIVGDYRQLDRLVRRADDFFSVYEQRARQNISWKLSELEGDEADELVRRLALTIQIGEYADEIRGVVSRLDYAYFLFDEKELRILGGDEIEGLPAYLVGPGSYGRQDQPFSDDEGVKLVDAVTKFVSRLPEVEAFCTPIIREKR